MGPSCKIGNINSRETPPGCGYINNQTPMAAQNTILRLISAGYHETPGQTCLHSVHHTKPILLSWQGNVKKNCIIFN